MPKTFAQGSSSAPKQKSDLDLSIEKAEKAQGGEDTERNLEKDISGSDNIWESSAEMHSITGKLTRPKNYKTPEQLRKEKKVRDNAEKERIRNEILNTVPVNQQDLNLFSENLAQKS